MRTVALAVCAAAPLALTSLPAAPAEATAGTAFSRLTGSIRLEGQQPAVVDKSSGTTLKIAIHSALPPRDLGVSATLFSKAVYLSSFEQTLTGNTAGLSVMSGTPGPLALPSLESGGGGNITLHLPVAAPDLPGSTGPEPKNGSILQVSCVAGGCAGVYPLQVSLVDLSEGVALDTITTYIVLAPPSEVASSVPLRFSLTIPLGDSTSITPSGSGDPRPGDEEELSLLQQILAGAGGLATSLAPSPQFVQALALSHSPEAAASLSVLRSFAQNPSATEVLGGTFTGAKLPALFSSGLGDEAGLQLQAGRRVLRRLLGTAGPPEIYATQSAIGARVLHLLTSSGVNGLVLPPGAAAPPSPGDLSIANLSPFVVSSSGTEAVESDSGLASHLRGSAGPVLRATQLLANLAVLYFQVPYARKGVELLTPRSWRPSAPFLRSLTTGLVHNPLVVSTTISGLFQSVPPGAVDPTGQLRSRRLAPGHLHRDELLSSAAVAVARSELAAIASVMPGRTRTTGALAQGVLMSETEGLSPGTRRAYLAVVTDELRREAALVSLPFGRVITITSLTARVPISIVSRAHRRIHVVVTASSPDLAFPGKTTFDLWLVPHTNNFPIPLSARTAGDFHLRLEVSAPTGTLLASGRITIRSTAISGVAIALSLAALAVLVIWWFRSIHRRRRGRGRGGARGGALAGRTATSRSRT